MSYTLIFSLFITVLVVVSIVYNFWIYVAVTGGIVFAILLIIGFIAISRGRTTSRFVDNSIQQSSSRNEIRGIIEKEWQSQDNEIEDLR